jgi:RNA polymerase sigma factor (sigma-70 family)
MKMVRTRGTSDPATVSDGELAQQAADGDTAAFEELYKRHAQAAWRVAQAVAGNPDDAADAVANAFTRVFQALPSGRISGRDAFRPYLLATTRNAAIDELRRGGKVRPSDTLDLDAVATTSPSPSDRMMDGVDSSLVAAAFRSLPERWRSVLWLTEVEQMAPRDAADLLGVSPNGVSQLAVRARAGLRERFLQAHLRGEVAPDCRSTVELLGAYVAGALAPRDVAKVDQHLAGCEGCRQRQAELEDLGPALRKIVLPLPLVLRAMTISHWKLGLGALKSAVRVPRSAASKLLGLERPLAVATTGLFALGIIGLGVTGQPGAGKLAPHRTLAAPGNRVPTASLDQRPAISLDNSRAFPGDGFVITPVVNGGQTAVTSGGTPTGSGGAINDGTDSAPPPLGPPSTPPPPPATAPMVQASVGVNLGPVSTSLAAGDGCTGVTLVSTTAGCTPPAPASSTGATVSTSGSILGDHTVTLP